MFRTAICIIISLVTLGLAAYLRAVAHRVQAFDAKYRKELDRFEANKQRELWNDDEFCGRKEPEGPEESSRES